MLTFIVLQEIVSDNLRINKEDITPSSRLIEDLGADSLDLIELIMILEEKFDFEIPDNSVESFKTIQDILDFIQNLKA